MARLGNRHPAHEITRVHPFERRATSIHAAAAKPADNSPLGVILDASADEAQNTVALNRLFENSAHSNPEALAVSARPAAAAGIIGAFPATEYTSLKSAIKARGVKAALAMQASRTQREGRYWFTVNILGTGDDFKKIEDLFEKDSNGWSYAGIPTDIQLRGTPVDPAALVAQGPNEFAQAPDWFDVSQLKFDALVKSGTGGTAVLRYGWRKQFEMSVFVFPGSASVSFKEYSANPMGKPKQSLEASLQKAPSRAMAAQILRAVQARNPVSGKDKATLDAILALLSTLVHDRSQRVPDQASAIAPSRGRTQDNSIAFYFSSLNPTSRYFLGTHPTQIQNIGGRGIIMSVSRDNGSQGSYLVRYVNGEGVEVLHDGLKAPTQPALRGLQEMLMLQLQSGALRDPLYARMLEEIRATLAPAYVPGTPDPLWRYLWKFRYSKVNPTVAYYAGYRTGTVATPRDGAIEMVLRRDASKIILTWRTGSGFKAKREDGFVFTPNKRDLRGMQLSLMREMLEDGSRERLALTLLQNFQDAVGD